MLPLGLKWPFLFWALQCIRSAPNSVQLHYLRTAPRWPSFVAICQILPCQPESAEMLPLGLNYSFLFRALQCIRSTPNLVRHHYSRITPRWPSLVAICLIPSMTTGMCRNVTLRVKLRFPFLGTSMYLIGTIFCAALLLEDYAKVAKFGGNLSNPSVTTGKCRNVTLRVKLGFPFLGTSMYPIGTKFSAAPLLEDYAKVAKFGGNLSNHSMTTGKCRNVTLRVKLRFPFSGTSMYPIGTIFSAAPLLEDYAKVAKFGGNLSNPSMPTGKWRNVTLRVSFFGLFNVSDRHQIWCSSTT